MRDEPDRECLELFEVLPPAPDQELSELIAAALGAGRLGLADWLSLRDLRELSGCDGFTFHALLMALFSALSDGNLCLSLDPGDLERRLVRLGVPLATAPAWAARIHAEFRPEAYLGIVAQEPGEFAPLVAKGRKLFFQRHHAWGEILATRLRERLRGPLPEPPPWATLEPLLHQVLEADPIRLDGKRAVLGEEQRQALLLALQRPFLIVSGGPGTGKTALVLAMLRCFLRLGFQPERILLAAPTGRAARNLTDVLRSNLPQADAQGSPDQGLSRIEAATLHRLLGFNPSRGTFAHGPTAPLWADLVIIDEVSMVDAILMARLLEALRSQTRLILLGDKDQLPSVEAGALLADLIPPDPEPQPRGGALVVLDRNYRCQIAILEAAKRINVQDPNVIAGLPRLDPARGWPPLAEWRPGAGAPGGCWWIPCDSTDPGPLHRAVRAWAQRNFCAPPAADELPFEDLVRRFSAASEVEQEDLLPGLLAVLKRARILTPIRRSAWGCEALNGRLADLLRPRLDPSGSGPTFAGAPILITRNDHARRLYNGDVGLLLRRAGALVAFFPAEPRPLAIPLGLLPAWEPAWASTVHKAQGSEYEQVLIAVPPQGAESLLTKEILYTGITRARSLAVLHGSQAVLEAAVARRVERSSGFDFWD